MGPLSSGISQPHERGVPVLNPKTLLKQRDLAPPPLPQLGDQEQQIPWLALSNGGVNCKGRGESGLPLRRVREYSLQLLSTGLEVS